MFAAALNLPLSGRIEFDCMTVLSGHENEVKLWTQAAQGMEGHGCA